MTKYDDEEERTQFLSWLEKTEYEELELPRPDLVILLDIPLGMSEALVKARAAEGGSMDIHEQHLDYLRKCHDAYQTLLRLGAYPVCQRGCASKCHGYRARCGCSGRKGHEKQEIGNGRSTAQERQIL